MVKTKASLLVACVGSLALLAGCAGRQLIDVHPESLAIPVTAPGASVSLALTDTSLLGVYSDTSNTTLDQIEIPISAHLPAQAPAPSVIDKVDSSPPLSATFGSHVLLTHDGVATVLYQDRESDVKVILKLVSRPFTASQWYLDVMEPQDSPLRSSQDPKGAVSPFWAAGSLLGKTGSNAPNALLTPFNASRSGSLASGTGFTTYDEGTRTLFLVRRSATGTNATPVVGATGVQSSLMDASGRVAVLTWNKATRRLLLLEEGSTPDQFSSSTVTLCEGTTNVQILPGRSSSTFAFLFDESIRRGGSTIHQLSLIASASRLGALGNRYRKSVLMAGTDAIKGFAAVETGDALYVLVAGAGLTVLRIGI